MNKTISIIISLLILAGGFYLYSTTGSTDKMMDDKGAMMEEVDTSSDSMMKDTEGAMMEDGSDMTMSKAGSYVAYSADKIKLAETGKVVLFFRASWCPTCRGLDADIKANMNKIPADVTILDVNYDNSAELKKKYGVTYQHTLVQVDSNGGQIAKWSSSPTLSDIVKNIK